jgi:hypothetical protein
MTETRPDEPQPGQPSPDEDDIQDPSPEQQDPESAPAADED